MAEWTRLAPNEAYWILDAIEAYTWLAGGAHTTNRAIEQLRAVRRAVREINKDRVGRELDKEG